MRLRVEDLSELKEAFDSHEGGVDLCNFVSVLLDKLEWTDATPRCVQYIPELKRIFAFESSRPVIQVFDPSAILAAESGAIEQNEPPRTGDQPTTPAFTLPLLHELHPLCYQHGYRKDQDQVRSERSPVQVDPLSTRPWLHA
ncbi:hypothetical protein SPRG_17356 [Saprolegnia parasitica CBS 223.65]|uniref:Uncharacterized protein n=1 Tax=Saprolegnia parasitica (strain CBS 223.65) TaxID=695850 RepID=A0A067BR28_SAPPC|nr:hypothetical protein SPRG_17356 [Saprolegnia parasitica CBS 223.65]KDO17132.1 hypothetical protein SPRG_17356 [Saprolegnia parasitica CBS 223.65]|eukprot:XP_012212158.1 hypothetical protein SPRG_17356 [Saprolegnia parasitica CBS 223.65]